MERAAAPPRWLTLIIASGALLIPLVMSASGEDSFRYPKELALRLEVLMIIVAVCVAWGFDRLHLPRLVLTERWMVITAAICGWTVICALLSTNRLVSIPPTARVLAYAVLFIFTVLTLRSSPVWAAALVLPPAIVNGTVYILQEFEIWLPFATRFAEKHLRRTALIGNPNDVGSYLVVPVLIATALAVTQARGRLLWSGAALFLFAATFITHTVAAVGALVVALFVMFAISLRSWPKRIVAFLAVIVAAGAVFALYPPLRQRAIVMRDAVVRRDYETLSAARSLPFLTAAEMTLDRPLTGVGPGCFSYNFFEYKLRVQQRHRGLFGPDINVYNFGEVHNDHLQVSSETGLPGYALLIAALVFIASGSRKPERDLQGDARATFVRILALPLAVSFFVLALAQFPLELVAPTHTYLWGAAIVAAWKEPLAP